MRNRLQTILCLILLVSAVPMILLLSAGNSSAQDGGCHIEATKSAPGAGDFEFVFTGIADSEPIPEFTLADDESTGGSIPQGVSVIITETPQNGYRFGGIDCDAEPGIIISETDDGFSIMCVDERVGSASCVIRNVSLVSAVPTLSEWGMLTVFAGMGIIGVSYVARRRLA
jgi:hypothetical protein